MMLSGNTVLIAGGSNGIGYEFAAQLLKRGNTVIVTGRDRGRLEQAQKSLPSIHTIQSDIGDSKAIPLLFDTVIEKFPKLNVLINNAGIMRKINLLDERHTLDDISREIETNLTGTVRMVAQFLPHLKGQDAAAIVNVSSGLAFVPLPIAPGLIATIDIPAFDRPVASEPPHVGNRPLRCSKVTITQRSCVFQNPIVPKGKNDESAFDANLGISCYRRMDHPEREQDERKTTDPAGYPCFYGRWPRSGLCNWTWKCRDSRQRGSQPDDSPRRR